MRKASETEVDYKVMRGVTANRGQESRGSHLDDPDSEHLYAPRRKEGKTSWPASLSNVVQPVVQEPEGD